MLVNREEYVSDVLFRPQLCLFYVKHKNAENMLKKCSYIKITKT